MSRESAAGVFQEDATIALTSIVIMAEESASSVAYDIRVITRAVQHGENIRDVAQAPEGRAAAGPQTLLEYATQTPLNIP